MTKCSTDWYPKLNLHEQCWPCFDVWDSYHGKTIKRGDHNHDVTLLACTRVTSESNSEVLTYVFKGDPKQTCTLACNQRKGASGGTDCSCNISTFGLKLPRRKQTCWVILCHWRAEKSWVMTFMPQMLALFITRGRAHGCVVLSEFQTSVF